MQHSPADVVRHLLVQLGQATLPTAGGAWPAHVASEPSDPDDCVTVYDTAGTSDGRDMVSGEVWGHYGFQIRVRAKTHPEGWAKADEIFTALSEGLTQVTVAVGAARYLVPCVARFGDILALGKDRPTSARFLFTLNATAAIQELE